MTIGYRIRAMTDEELDKCGGITQNRPDEKPIEGQVYFDKQNKKDYKYKNGKWVETPRTNADRIRSMTDDELAEWECNRACTICQIEDCKGRMEEGREKCRQRWLDWLEQEV